MHCGSHPEANYQPSAKCIRSAVSHITVVTLSLFLYVLLCFFPVLFVSFPYLLLCLYSSRFPCLSFMLLHLFLFLFINLPVCSLIVFQSFCFIFYSIFMFGFLNENCFFLNSVVCSLPNIAGKTQNSPYCIGVEA